MEQIKLSKQALFQHFPGRQAMSETDEFPRSDHSRWLILSLKNNVSRTHPRLTSQSGRQPAVSPGMNELLTVVKRCSPAGNQVPNPKQYCRLNIAL